MTKAGKAMNVMNVLASFLGTQVHCFAERCSELGCSLGMICSKVKDSSEVKWFSRIYSSLILKLHNKPPLLKYAA